MSLEQFQSVIDVNLKGVFLTVRDCMEKMIELNCEGLICLIASTGMLGTAGQINYSSSKAAVGVMPKVLTAELFRRKLAHRIRCVALAPGYVKTPILEKMNRKALEKILLDVPIQRLVEPREIASLAAGVVSEPGFGGRRFLHPRRSSPEFEGLTGKVRNPASLSNSRPFRFLACEPFPFRKSFSRLFVLRRTGIVPAKPALAGDGHSLLLPLPPSLCFFDEFPFLLRRLDSGFLEIARLRRFVGSIRQKKRRTFLRQGFPLPAGRFLGSRRARHVAKMEKRAGGKTIFRSVSTSDRKSTNTAAEP